MRIRAAVPADLLDKIYKSEGWTRKEGEVRAIRVKAEGWTLSRQRNVYVAVKD